MSIDWSKAPEGATHYLDCIDELIWIKVDGDSIFSLTRGGAWRKSVVAASEALKDPDYKPIPRPTSTEKPVDWSAAPFDATHAAFLPDIQQHIFFKFADDRWFDVKNKEWSYVGGKPNFDLIERPKTLTQAVFDGLPSKYRWASVSNNGTGAARVYCGKPFLLDGNEQWMNLLNDDWCLVGDGYDTTNWQNSLIERQDDLAAKAKEISDRHPFAIDQSTQRKHSHYFKDVSGVDQIDVYAVLRLFEVTDPCLQHIVKKALCAGKRGAKNWAKDVQEIADTAQRLIELESGK